MFQNLRKRALEWPMGDKARQRTKDWKERVVGYLLAETARNAIKEHNFRRLKDLGIIREEK